MKKMKARDRIGLESCVLMNQIQTKVTEGMNVERKMLFYFILIYFILILQLTIAIGNSLRTSCT